MTMRRRDLLAGAAGAAGAGLLAPFAHPLLAAPVNGPFQHGVASGDPLQDRVLLWTRVSGETGPANVNWVIARDPALRDVERRGTATTDADRDHCVKVTVSGLHPGSTWYYRFETRGERSPVGRTRTLPRNPDHVRLGFASCSNMPFGHFNAYRRLAERGDLAAVLHLGDYIYEYPEGRYGEGAKFGESDGVSRVPRPDREISTLDDYRTRYAQYRSDPDLQELHRQHPFIVVWDDHEITNNAWLHGAENHQPEDGEGDWYRRREAAVQAYFEWMPIREPEPWPSHRIYRSFRFGRLLDLVMLDTRLIGRSRQAEWGDAEAMAHPARTLLGKEQERWLFSELRDAKLAGVRWPVLGQQVMMGPMLDERRAPMNSDQWDGYQVSRNRVFDEIERERLDNLVVLTGDVHQSWGMDLPRDPHRGYDRDTGRGSFGVDFVTTAVSSPSSMMRQLGDEGAVAEAVRDRLALNPHMKFGEAWHRGYCVLDVLGDRVQNDWFFVPTVDEKTDEEWWAAGLQVAAGSRHGVRADRPADEGPASAPPAPPVL